MNHNTNRIFRILVCKLLPQSIETKPKDPGREYASLGNAWCLNYRVISKNVVQVFDFKIIKVDTREIRSIASTSEMYSKFKSPSI
jgi:hypothetical protein